MISKISARTLVLGAVFFGLTLSPALATQPEGPGDAGPNIDNQSQPSETTSTGGDGSDGYQGGSNGHPTGYDGGNGGDINVTINGGGSSSSSPPEGVSYTSTGGEGGKGAEAVEECQSDCGGLEEPAPAGSGGNGGHGGTVNVTLEHGTVYGDLSATSEGGKGGMDGFGMGGMPGAAGDAGEVTVRVASTGVVIGDVIAKSLGGNGHGEDPNGAAGDVTVTISGVVTGNVAASSEGGTTGTVKVAISGGTVEGIISGGNAHNSSLSFKFDVSDRNEFNAATQALTGSGAEGHVTINGNLYRWEGFSTLVDLLRYVGAEDKVEITVQQPSEPASVNTTADPVAEQPKPQAPVQVAKVFGEIPLVTGKPEMAKCSGSSEVRTVRQDDGSIVVIHHSRGDDTLIGQLKDGEFHRSQAAQDWDVQVGNEGTSVDVSNGGNAISSCSFS